MDAADPPPVARDVEPGVLGNLPPTRPQHRSARRRGPSPTALARTDSAPKRAVVPNVPAPPAAPRSGWAAPEPTGSPASLPPLVALADGAVRTGAQLLRGVLRRLPGG